MSHATFKHGIGLVLSFALVVAAGCKSDHDNRAEVMTESISSMQSARQGLVDANKEVDDTLAAMNALPGASDMNAAMTTFKDKVKETEDTAANAKEKAADMRARGREYVNQWEDNMSQVTDPAMRQNMTARQEAVRANFSSIRSAMRDAADAYTPYMAHLKDIETALALDMTPAGIKTVQPTMAKATAEGATLKEKINAVIAKMDSVTNAMAPAQPAK